MKNIFLVVLALIFLTYLFFLWQPVETLLTNFLTDDAFYYFKIASNIAKGLGPTFDGEHLTNGYHPLWMGVVSGVYYIFPNDRILPIHIILTIAVALFFLTSLFVYKIISSFTESKSIPIFLTLAYALNPWNVSIHLNGLETPLALFLFVLFVFIFLKTLGGKGGNLNFYYLGVTGGLLVLARLDYGIFLAAVFVFFLLRLKHKEIRVKNLLAFVLPAGAISAPWFLYNYFYFGSLIPTSGLSYTLINHRLFFYKPRGIGTIFLWSVYNFFGTIAFTLKSIGLPIYYSAKNVPKTLLWTGGVFLAPLLAVSYLYFKNREKFKAYIHSIFKSVEWRVFLTLFIGYCVLVFVHGAVRWSGREWYFATFQILTLVFLGIVLSNPTFLALRKPILTTLAVLLLTSYAFYFRSIFPHNKNQLEMYNVAMWVKDNLPPNARIASFNSGIHGYFSDRFVMNSDGLVNNEAYKAMKKDGLWELFKKEKIDYIVDYEIVLSYRYKSFLGIDDPLSKVVKEILPNTISQEGNYGGTHVNIYKL
ncbi:MAG TPA: hypothetical protein VJJ73_02515 [Candidatus Paceibacterota bacterium]